MLKTNVMIFCIAVLVVTLCLSFDRAYPAEANTCFTVVKQMLSSCSSAGGVYGCVRQYNATTHRFEGTWCGYSGPGQEVCEMRVQVWANTGNNSGMYVYDNVSVTSLFTSFLPQGMVSGAYNVAPENCDKPQCNPPNAINPQGDCVLCPSAYFEVLTGACVNLCPHGTFLPVGSLQYVAGVGTCVVPGCTTGEKLIEGKCYPDCADRGMKYNVVTGGCGWDCPSGYKVKLDESGCESVCPQGQEWHDASPGLPGECLPSVTPTPDCKMVNGIEGVRGADGKCRYKPLDPLDCAEGYEPDGLDCVQRPLDCGEGKHQEGDKCVSNPPVVPGKTDPPAPSEVPAETPSPQPTPDPAAPADEKAQQYLKNIDTNIAKLINASNSDKTILKNIAENQGKAVDNSKAGVEEAAKQSQTLRESKEVQKDISTGIAGLTKAVNNATDTPVKNAVDSAADRIVDKIDDTKTDSTGPAQPGFDGGVENVEQYNANASAEEQAAIAAQRDKGVLSSLLTGISPVFQMTATVDQNACISGAIRGTPVIICFDRPWMLQGFAIMKIIMVAMAYVQVIQLINSALKG